MATPSCPRRGAPKKKPLPFTDHPCIQIGTGLSGLVVTVGNTKNKRKHSIQTTATHFGTPAHDQSTHPPEYLESRSKTNITAHKFRTANNIIYHNLYLRYLSNTNIYSMTSKSMKHKTAILPTWVIPAISASALLEQLLVVQITTNTLRPTLASPVTEINSLSYHWVSHTPLTEPANSSDKIFPRTIHKMAYSLFHHVLLEL